MLLDILDLTGVAASDALMVGDTEYDLQMARNAGVDCVGVGCGVHAPERLSACGPVVYLHQTCDLLAWLQAGKA